jgi:hypothetical protein
MRVMKLKELFNIQMGNCKPKDVSVHSKQPKVIVINFEWRLTQISINNWSAIVIHF